MSEGAASRNVWSTTGLVMASVACLLFVTGLVKGPAPSDGIRQILVLAFGGVGLAALLLGWVVGVRKR